MNRNEARKVIMTILYQIFLYQRDNIDYNVTDVINENLSIDNEFVKDMINGVLSKKEELYDKALDHFDYHRIALYDQKKYDELMQTEGLIKNRLKMKAIITNAKAFLEIQKQYGSFDSFIWSYVDFQPVQHHYQTSQDVPSSDELSTQISKDLKKHGFCFVGPTIIYSYLQAIGIYNDHEINCDFY